MSFPIKNSIALINSPSEICPSAQKLAVFLIHVGISPACADTVRGIAYKTKNIPTKILRHFFFI